VSGPTYETPVDDRFLGVADSDVVGMSTIPEVVVAREEWPWFKLVIPDEYRSIK